MHAISQDLFTRLMTVAADPLGPAHRSVGGWGLYFWVAVAIVLIIALFAIWLPGRSKRLPP